MCIGETPSDSLRLCKSYIPFAICVQGKIENLRGEKTWESLTTCKVFMKLFILQKFLLSCGEMPLQGFSEDVPL